MSALKKVIILFLLFPSTAVACEIEDCSLPSSLHKVNGETSPTHGVWTWLHHDLALARKAIHSGDEAHALNLALTLDQIIRRRLADLIAFSGAESLIDFHRAIQGVVNQAGGWPLPEIKVGGKEA